MIQHKGVIFIITRNKKALLQLRDNNSARYKNMWCFPGGGSEEEETYDETLKREVFEEYSIDIDPKNCELLMMRNEGRTNHVFVCPINDDQEPILHEGADMKWMDIEEIKSLELGFEQDDVVKEWEGWLKK